MRAKEYLQQTFEMNKKINHDLKDIADLREMAESLSGSTETERVQKTKSADPPFVKALSRIWEMEQIIDEEVEQLMNLKIEIRSIINQVKNVDQQMVLRYRYLSLDSWEQIAEQMGFSLRYTYDLHGKALKSVDEILRNNSSLNRSKSH